MKKLNSKIHTLFSDEILRLLASVCDSRRIDSYHQKMILVQQILKRYNIKFRMLGGATNRLTLMIDGYAVKFAIDRQGYKDNLMEYSLSPELQPYVARTSETNGYIVVSECVRTMTLDDFRILKSDICKVLEALSRDYLLGDVGYITRNFTNWGIRDNGDVVILDYAYCHRATEKLFSCDVCGEGVLRYDATYSYLMCSNRGVCNTKYNYMERKSIQGDKVDIDMINEAKEESFVLPSGKNFVQLNDDNADADVVVVDTLDKYKKYLKEDLNMSYFDDNEALSLMIKKLDSVTKEDNEAIDKQLGELVNDSIKQQRRPRTVVTYDDNEYDEPEEEVNDEDLPDAAYGSSISELIRMTNEKPCNVELDYDDEYILDDVIDVVNSNIKNNTDENEQHIDDNVSEESTECVPESEVGEESEKAEIPPVEDNEGPSVDNASCDKDDNKIVGSEEETTEEEIDPEDYEGILLNGRPLIEMEK